MSPNTQFSLVHLLGVPFVMHAKIKAAKFHGFGVMEETHRSGQVLIPEETL